MSGLSVSRLSPNAMGLIPRRLLPFLIVVLLSGCLDYNERITVNRDGSATIQLRLQIANTLRSLLGRNPAFGSLGILMSESRLKQSLPDGVELVSHQVVAGASRKTYYAELFAPDVQNLQLGASPAFKGQTFDVQTGDDGTIHYKRELDFTEAGRDPELRRMIAENRMGIVGILKSSQFTFEFETPLPVKSTNGEKDADGAVSWSYSLLSLVHEPAEQELVMTGPGTLDLILGAARMALRPNYAPFTAAGLLAIFFIIAIPLGRRKTAE